MTKDGETDTMRPQQAKGKGDRPEAALLSRTTVDLGWERRVQGCGRTLERMQAGAGLHIEGSYEGKLL